MSATQLLTFNLALIVSMASPGPALLCALRATLAGGRAAGLQTGVGLGLMASVWTLLALLGLDGIFRVVPFAYALLKGMGAAYLLYVAWSVWRDASRPPESRGSRSLSPVLNGVLVNLANPKSVVFAAAVLVVIFPPDLPGTHKALIVGNHLLIEVTVYALFAVCMSTDAVARRYLRAKRLVDRAAATVLAALGIRLLLDRN